MDISPNEHYSNGHFFERTTIRITINNSLNKQFFEWTLLRRNNSSNGHFFEWTTPRMDISPNEQRMNTNIQALKSGLYLRRSQLWNNSGPSLKTLESSSKHTNLMVLYTKPHVADPENTACVVSLEVNGYFNQNRHGNKEFETWRCEENRP